MITGIQMVNFGSLVLCLKAYMPARQPKEPPKMEITKKAAFGIRHLFPTAFFLSAPIRMNPITPMKATYINRILRSICKNKYCDAYQITFMNSA